MTRTILSNFVLAAVLLTATSGRAIEGQGELQDVGAASMRAVPVAQLKQQKNSPPAAPSGSLSAPADRRLPVIEGGGSLKQPCGMGHLGCLDGDPPSGKGFNPKK